ncbi:tubulin--tyrosine ligase-like protein 12 [Teleopsis dalmanni]|uniref:tubulin--tyrosine ligase-like protein 12 n=1 Tax=Teleopsis dalmanni TaxID=139649 RepID=UPI0018CD5982|nr:tubulin--tyrosine ligase-like protein 12 [Teleopsis dalmanni]
MAEMNSYEMFVQLHLPQLESCAIPQHFWKSLHAKIIVETFDAGEVFNLLYFDYSDHPPEVRDSEMNETCMLLAQREIKANDTNAIYLIDHAWSFQINGMRQQLEQYRALTERLCAIAGVSTVDPARINKLMRRLWKYSNSYTIQTQRTPNQNNGSVWYVVDEVGCAIKHSDIPNFRLVPFLYQNTKITYSLLFPIRDCEAQQQVYCDFLEHISKDDPHRIALLLPWIPMDLTEKSFVQTEPGAGYFTSGHVIETYPVGSDLSDPIINRNEPLKVYSEYTVLRECLTDVSFALVDNERDADVLWLTSHFKDFAELSEETPNKFINQFPFEYVITIKDLLSITCRRAAAEHHNAETLETYPNWLPTTYNLKTETLEFASYYQNRVVKQFDNHWIIKPWNLARGMDTHITNYIDQIMRISQTGPKIAQKYLERPVLFYREELDTKVKFDIRYVLLLKSVSPLEAYVHKKFFLRFANKPFSLDSFEDYEKHFTVMNYQEEVELRHIKCEDFVNIWKDQYPNSDWAGIEDEICAMLHEMLTCATKMPPPCGIAHSPQSRALYAADIMLEWKLDGKTMQPKLLEINWTPDCKRACDYYPDFYNNIFKLLFLNESNEECFRLLTPS